MKGLGRAGLWQAEILILGLPTPVYPLTHTSQMLEETKKSKALTFLSLTFLKCKKGGWGKVSKLKGSPLGTEGGTGKREAEFLCQMLKTRIPNTLGTKGGEGGPTLAFQDSALQTSPLSL